MLPLPGHGSKLQFSNISVSFVHSWPPLAALVTIFRVFVLNEEGPHVALQGPISQPPNSQSTISKHNIQEILV